MRSLRMTLYFSVFLATSSLTIGDHPGRLYERSRYNRLANIQNFSLPLPLPLPLLLLRYLCHYFTLGYISSLV